MSATDSGATWTISKCYSRGHAQILAPELLAMIFHDVMAPHERRPILLLPITNKHPENEIDTRPLLALSHVCRYWRNVAIGTPALWTRVHWRNRDQMDAFLERSSPLAVTVFLDREHVGDNWNGPFPHRMSSAVGALALRLRRLDLAMPPIWHNVISLLARLKAPQLECLTIMSPDASWRLRSVLYWTPLLDGKASSLRGLGLLSVLDWLPSSAFPNLTHLILYFASGLEELRPSHPFNLLRLISNTPVLEFLHVDNLLYDAPYRGSWQPPPNPIPLPRLRSLVFTDCPYKVLHVVFPRISFPDDVFIRLQEIDNCLLEDGPPAPLAPLSIRPVTHLDVAMRGTELLMVADGPTSGLWFGLEHDPEPQDWSAWLLGLPECLPLMHVTHLHIFVEGGEAFWPTLLARMPQIAHLAVLLGESSDDDDFTGSVPCDSPTATLCSALSAGEAGFMLCLALDTLAIEWPHKIMRDDLLDFPRLLEMLKGRDHAGYPIRRVVVQVPAADPSSGDELRVEGLSFIELHKLASIEGRPRGTEYEVIEKPEVGGRGLCAFQMREVWRVEGEDRYWDVGERAKPNYHSVSGL